VIRLEGVSLRLVRPLLLVSVLLSPATEKENCFLKKMRASPGSGWAVLHILLRTEDANVYPEIKNEESDERKKN